MELRLRSREASAGDLGSKSLGYFLPGLNLLYVRVFMS